MLWFFILPCVGFIAWASFELGRDLWTQKPSSAWTQLEQIEKAKNPGDRWQAAYALSRELHKMIRSNELEQLNDEQKNQLYGRIQRLIEDHKNDGRLRHYLFLTLAHMKDKRGLTALRAGARDNSDTEARFYAVWGLLQILSSQSGARTPEDDSLLRDLLKVDDPSLRKITTSYLAQTADEENLRAVRNELNDNDDEIRWNAAVALASVGDSSSAPVLGELFELKRLRNQDFHSAQDLQNILRVSYLAAKKLGNAEVLEKAELLKQSVSNDNPEGRAIHAALRD